MGVLAEIISKQESIQSEITQTAEPFKASLRERLIPILSQLTALKLECAAFSRQWFTLSISDQRDLLSIAKQVTEAERPILGIIKNFLITRFSEDIAESYSRYEEARIEFESALEDQLAKQREMASRAIDISRSDPVSVGLHERGATDVADGRYDEMTFEEFRSRFVFD